MRRPSSSRRVRGWSSPSRVTMSVSSSTRPPCWTASTPAVSTESARRHCMTVMPASISFVMLPHVIIIQYLLPKGSAPGPCQRDNIPLDSPSAIQPRAYGWSICACCSQRAIFLCNFNLQKAWNCVPPSAALRPGRGDGRAPARTPRRAAASECAWCSRRRGCWGPPWPGSCSC